MSKIDKEAVHKKLEELVEYVKKLTEFKKMSEEKFLSDYHHFGLAEHYLQLAIEIVLDVCRHLTVALELKTPEDSRAIFEILSENKILPKKFSEKNKNMAGFRNRLVHAYSEIDHKKVYEYLKNYGQEFEKFISIIAKFLERK